MFLCNVNVIDVAAESYSGVFLIQYLMKNWQNNIDFFLLNEAKTVSYVVLKEVKNDKSSLVV